MQASSAGITDIELCVNEEILRVSEVTKVWASRMTPQSNFMVVAPIRPGRLDPLKSVLASMTGLPGTANPQNPIFPFGSFEELHYARFVILDDRTLDDLAAFGESVPVYPIALAFIVDCDGAADDCLAHLVRDAGEGLRQVFSHCEGFAAEADLQIWMKSRFRDSAASYVNWIGRTVRQVREEAALRGLLLRYLKAQPVAKNSLQSIREELVAVVDSALQSGALTLTPAAATPLGWKIRNLLHCCTVPLCILVLLVLVCLIPVLLVPLVLFAFVFVWLLRRYEKTEPEINVRMPPQHSEMLARLEDHDVSNQFTVLGSVKPSLFRTFAVTVILWLTDYGARHVYNRGRLGRIQTIHFARWTFLDGKKRVLFASNYDGSLEAYMDDFINKVGWGLNLVFSNGVAYPRTHWLVRDGSKCEQQFKYTLRRHQLPTEVWYKAYPGLTAFDIARNTRVRKGAERRSMTDAEIRGWLQDL